MRLINQLCNTTVQIICGSVSLFHSWSQSASDNCNIHMR